MQKYRVLDKHYPITYIEIVNQGKTPIRKNGDSQSAARGKTPIEKNILVVDEFGRRYEATYPKRAKGLVKNGRARFLSENMICLACPPNLNDLEDYIMTDKNNVETVPHTDIELKAASAGKVTEIAEFSISSILAQMSAIQSDTAYIRKALDSLLGIVSGKVPFETGIGPVHPVASAAEAVGRIVASRETTNQQLLRIYDHALFQLIGAIEEKTAEPE